MRTDCIPKLDGCASGLKGTFMKKKVSNKKMKANQQNATLSTGPKTEQGKAIVRWNSLKHGFFSREVFIKQGDGKENRVEFDRLAESLMEDLQPKGTFERLLFDRILVCCWRLKRVLRYEMGVLRSQLDTAVVDLHNRLVDSMQAVLMSNRYGGAKKKLLTTSVGVNFLLQILAEVREGLIERGFIDSKVHKKLVDYFGSGEGSLAAMCSDFVSEAEGADNIGGDGSSDTEGFEEDDEAREQVLAAISDKVEELDWYLEATVELERLRTEGYLASLCLPPEGPANQIMRYETSIERQLYRAIAELGRLQRERRGQ
jgi:hypothetical protein